MLLIGGHKIYNTEFLLLFMFSFNYLSLRCHLLYIRCNTGLNLTECPFGAECNKVLGLCQCKPEYPIYLSERIPCLNYSKLGERCIYSFQCSRTLNAVCYDKYSNELNTIVKNYDYYEYVIENYGKCQCEYGVREISCLNNFIFEERCIYFK